MDKLLEWGRIFFAIGMAGFGIQYLGYGRFEGGLPPVPPYIPNIPVVAYLVGAFLVAASVSILIKKKARLSAMLVGLLFLLCVLLLHSLRLTDVVLHGTARTRALEPLALGGAAFVLAGTLPAERSKSAAWDALTKKLIQAGRFIFGFCMLIFGMQHFEYAGYIATLVPAWIPWHLLWTYFFGCAMVAAGIAIIMSKQARMAAFLLGVMFLLWVAVLHGPRVTAALHNADEWSSLLVALATGGGAFVIARAIPGSLEHGRRVTTTST